MLLLLLLFLLFLVFVVGGADPCAQIGKNASICGYADVSLDSPVDLMNPTDVETMVYRISSDQLTDFAMTNVQSDPPVVLYYHPDMPPVTASISCDIDCTISWRNLFATRQDIERDGWYVLIVLGGYPTKQNGTRLLEVQSSIAPRSALTNFMLSALDVTVDPKNVDVVNVLASISSGPSCPDVDPTAVYLLIGEDNPPLLLNNQGGGMNWIGEVTRADVYNFGRLRNNTTTENLYDLNLTISIKSGVCDQQYDNLAQSGVGLVVRLDAPEVTVWMADDLSFSDLIFDRVLAVPFIDDAACFLDAARLAVTVAYSYSYSTAYQATSYPGSGSMDGVVRLDLYISDQCIETIDGPMATRACTSTFLTGNCLAVVKNKKNGSDCAFEYIGDLDLTISVSYSIGITTQTIPYRRIIPGKTFADDKYTTCPQEVQTRALNLDSPPVLDLVSSGMLQVFELTIAGGPDSSVRPVIQTVSVSYEKGDGVVRMLQFSAASKRRGMYDKNSFYYDDVIFCRTVQCEIPFFLAVSPTEDTILDDPTQGKEWRVPGRGHSSCQNVTTQRNVDRWAFRPLDMLKITDPRTVVRANVTLTAQLSTCSGGRRLDGQALDIVRTTVEGLVFRLLDSSSSVKLSSGVIIMMCVLFLL
jgi:hypothetical protein